MRQFLLSVLVVYLSGIFLILGRAAAPLSAAGEVVAGM